MFALLLFLYFSLRLLTLNTIRYHHMYYVTIVIHLFPPILNPLYDIHVCAQVFYYGQYILWTVYMYMENWTVEFKNQNESLPVLSEIYQHIKYDVSKLKRFRSIGCTKNALHLWVINLLFLSISKIMKRANIWNLS